MTKNLQSWRWWGHRFTEIATAFALFYMVTNLLEYREVVRKNSIEPESWFLLKEIYVPDHEVGQNPGMIYDRVILENHRGFWVAEAQKVNPEGRQGVFRNACSGSGVDDYDITEVLGENNSVDWVWFFGRPCTIPPGVYRIQLTRDMKVPDYPVKKTRGYSNTFRVYAKGQMP